MLAYCEKAHGAIKQYYNLLLPEYKNDVGRIFAEYIRSQAKNANNRNRYYEVRQLILICDKACKNTAAEMRKEIAENYKMPCNGNPLN